MRRIALWGTIIGIAVICAGQVAAAQPAFGIRILTPDELNTSSMVAVHARAISPWEIVGTTMTLAAVMTGLTLLVLIKRRRGRAFTAPGLSTRSGDDETTVGHHPAGGGQRAGGVSANKSRPLSVPWEDAVGHFSPRDWR